MCYQKSMADSVKLAFEHLPSVLTSVLASASNEPAASRIVFLHGILGSGANLRTIARRFLAARPRWDAWLIDLRGHGESPKSTPNPSLDAAAADVRALIADGLPVGAVVGHSFGGKVALGLLRDGNSLSPRAHVVTLDSNPGTRVAPRNGDSALAVIEMLAALPKTFASRAAFIDAVTARGMSRGLAQWLGMSVAPDPVSGVRFGLDLDELRGLLHSYFAADLWGVLESPPDDVNVHIVIGAKSDSYSQQDRERAAAIAATQPKTTVDFLQTGHWVHAEDPDGVVRLLTDRIGRIGDG